MALTAIVQEAARRVGFRPRLVQRAGETSTVMAFVAAGRIDGFWELHLSPHDVGAGALLVALYTVSDFGAVSIARFNTFTLAIYNAYRTLFDRSVAAGLAPGSMSCSVDILSDRDLRLLLVFTHVAVFPLTRFASIAGAGTKAPAALNPFGPARVLG